MSIVDNKSKIFGKISALKTLNDGYPNFKRSNSYQSINNSGDSSAFLVDIIIALLGQDELKNICVDFLSSKLDDVEIKIKNCLRNTLNEKLSVGANPAIPQILFDGIDIKLKSIDINNMLSTDPLTVNGELLYNDNKTGLNSSDFNTFLFESLQSTDEVLWGHQILPSDMFIIKPSLDSINVKVDPSYQNKSLIDLNNDYIDTLDLYDSAKLINGIIDRLFGTISTSNKSKDDLVNEAKIDSILKSLIDSEDDIIIDDSFFNFTNNQLREFEETASNRVNGVMPLIDCGNYDSSVTIDTLSGITYSLNNTVDFVEKKGIIEKGLTDLSNEASADSSDYDKQAVKGSFFKNFTNSTSLGLCNAIITPKLLLILHLNSRVFDNTDNISEPIDVIKNNKVVFKTITCSCKDSIISLLLKTAVKEIIRMSTAQITNYTKEITKNQLVLTLSLIGVPQQILSIIRGL